MTAGTIVQRIGFVMVLVAASASRCSPSRREPAGGGGQCLAQQQRSDAAGVLQPPAGVLLFQSRHHPERADLPLRPRAAGAAPLVPGKRGVMPGSRSRSRPPRPQVSRRRQVSATPTHNSSRCRISAAPSRSPSAPVCASRPPPTTCRDRQVGRRAGGGPGVVLLEHGHVSRQVPELLFVCRRRRASGLQLLADHAHLHSHGEQALVVPRRRGNPDGLAAATGDRVRGGVQVGTRSAAGSPCGSNLKRARTPIRTRSGIQMRSGLVSVIVVSGCAARAVAG